MKFISFCSSLIIFGNITWINIFIIAKRKSDASMHVFLYKFFYKLNNNMINHIFSFILKKNLIWIWSDRDKIGDCNWIMIDCQWVPIKSNDWTVIDYLALPVLYAWHLDLLVYSHLSAVGLFAATWNRREIRRLCCWLNCVSDLNHCCCCCDCCDCCDYSGCYICCCSCSGGDYRFVLC